MLFRTSVREPSLSSRSTRRAGRKIRGFTLLDLIIALVILFVLLGIVIPSFTRFVAKVRALDARSQLTATLLEAQSQATILGQEIVVCPATGSQCLGGVDWSRGWIAFIDRDGNRRWGGNEPTLRRAPALKPGVRLLGSVGRPRIIFQPRGSSAGSNLSFTLCDRRGPTEAISLILANSGRLRSGKPAMSVAMACSAGL